jgi:hypothetical protein
MSYLTESQLASTLDVPVALAATELKMGDWLLLSTVVIVQPMVLTVTWLNMQLVSASVDVAQITNSNLIYGNLGLAYVALRLNYTSGGDPGLPGAVETLVATALGVTARDYTSPLVVTAPGTYSWLVANNMQIDPNNQAISPSTSIDFKLCVTGQARIDLSGA